MPFITDTVTFPVDDATEYSLTITIGGGVAGGATVMVDFKNKVQSPEVINVALGSGKAIRGKLLLARSTFQADGPSQFAGIDYTLNAATQSVSRARNGNVFWTFRTTIKFV